MELSEFVVKVVNVVSLLGSVFMICGSDWLASPPTRPVSPLVLAVVGAGVSGMNVLGRRGMGVATITEKSKLK